MLIVTGCFIKLTWNESVPYNGVMQLLFEFQLFLHTRFCIHLWISYNLAFQAITVHWKFSASTLYISVFLHSLNSGESISKTLDIKIICAKNMKEKTALRSLWGFTISHFSDDCITKCLFTIITMSKNRKLIYCSELYKKVHFFTVVEHQLNQFKLKQETAIMHLRRHDLSIFS